MQNNIRQHPLELAELWIGSSGQRRRFNAYSDYLKSVYGYRIQKLSIDAGFTCPNRDGTCGRGGCTFCNNDAFNPSYCTPQKTIRLQLEEGKIFHAWRYRKAARYVAYFQAYSNTYAPLLELKKRYEEALQVEGVVGLTIGTRPDCLNEENLDYLAELSQTYFVHLEIGIESCYDRTLQRVNRGHDYACTERAFEAAFKRGIKTGGHLILGMPQESREEQLAEATIISSLPMQTLKLHQLQIITDTHMAQEYKNTPSDFSFYTLEEYIDLVVDFLEKLSPNIKIDRLTGEVPPRFQAGPCFKEWRTDQILGFIEKRLEQRNTYQGRYYS
ncbi:MAG: TIGR01212 family radical SAM protein [Bacteroidales bacterium]